MLVSIAILTVISLCWWAPELGRWQRSEGAMLVTIVTALLEVQSVVRLPLGVVPADSLELEDPRGVF